MKALKPIFLLLWITSVARSQDFQNLDFESANLAGYPVGSSVPTSAAIPGWSAYSGGGATYVIAYDTAAFVLGSVIIADTNNPPGFGPGPIQGSYSVLLFAGAIPGSAFSANISQTGLVPMGTESLQMDVGRWEGAAMVPIVVMLDGHIINMAPLQSFADYTVYGGDISAFAGQTATLSITEPPPPPGPISEVTLDGIVFSVDPVPEPTTLALGGFGVLILGWRCLRRRH